MRVCATALESYFVDNNQYPPCRDCAREEPRYGYCWISTQARFAYLTTPISYISSAEVLKDPFDKWTKYGWWWEGFYWYDARYQSPWLWDTARAEHISWIPDGSQWCLKSKGPDCWDSMWTRDGANRGVEGIIQYDPTNGTVSDGDIWRLGP